MEQPFWELHYWLSVVRMTHGFRQVMLRSVLQKNILLTSKRLFWGDRMLIVARHGTRL